MSKTDEIFEKLGYEKRENKVSTRYTLYDNEEIYCTKRIVFYNNTKRISIHCDGESLDMQELQAINQICKEKGWLDAK